MRTADKPETQEDRGLIYFAVFAIISGLVIRCLLFPTMPAFWEDEIIAATHAVQPVTRLLVNVLRNEIHPPLYFLQLHLWTFISTDDRWLLANSLLWSFAALASIYVVAFRDTGNRQESLVVVAVLALLPQAVERANELRMYPMLLTLSIWEIYYTKQAFTENSRTADKIKTIILSIIITCTHAIGFIAVFLNALYALFILINRQSKINQYIIWLALFAVTAVFAAPILVSNMLHDANLPPFGSQPPYLSYASGLVLGAGPAFSDWQLAFGLALYLLVGVGGLATKRTRILTVAFLIAPLAIAVLGEMAVKPIFKVNFFATIVAPALALTIGRLVIGISSRQVRCIVFFALAGVFGYLAMTPNNIVYRLANFREIAAFVRTQAQPGDVVYVPQMSIFWGMAWYLDGPNWGSPLAIAQAPSPEWQRVYDRLGPTLVGALGLMPTTQVLKSGDLVLVTGRNGVPANIPATRVWLVTYKRADLPRGLPGDTLGALQRASTHPFSVLTDLTLYTTPP